MSPQRRDPTDQLSEAEFLLFVQKWSNEFLEICAKRKMKDIEKPLRDTIAAIEAALRKSNPTRLNNCASRQQRVAEAVVGRHIQKTFS